MRLRPFQGILKNDIYTAWDSGHKNVLAVSPTGSGKTVIFSDVLKDHKGASCAIAHRQELVTQISLALARDDVPHRIIGPTNVVKLAVNIHMNECGMSYYNPGAPCAVAGVDTLVRRRTALSNWLPNVTKWVQDECFPAGTLVDNIPIETIKRGDYVTAYNENTGGFEQRKVVRLFKTKAPEYMVSLQIGHHVLYCTRQHPILTIKGWKNAEYINESDTVYMVQKTGGYDRTQKTSIRKNRARLLWDKMFDRVSCENIIGNNEQNEPETRVGSNEKKQSDEKSNDTRESINNIKSNRAQTKNTGREREVITAGRNCTNYFIRWVRFYWTNKYKNRLSNWRRFGISASIQSRYRELRFKISNRSRWKFSRSINSKTTRQEKRQIFKWVRVDGVTIQKRNDIKNPAGRCKDGFVYNIEVKGLHTYTANGVVVHNCHHVLINNKWGKAVDMFPNAIGLGVTATPDRADGHGLGRRYDGVFDTMVEGPQMRALIDMGYLTDYRVFAPPSDIDLTNVTITASGEYSPEKLKKAVRKSHVVGDVVTHYLRIAPGKLGITFADNVETATDIAREYNRRGVPAAVVSANTPDAERVAVLRRFKARELLQLVNVDLFGEGFDLPAIEVVSMARPTQSYALYCQQFGRALRLMISDILSGVWDTYSDAQRRAFIAESIKPHAIIIDHVGNVVRHNLPDRPRVWSLARRDRNRKLKSEDDIPVTACPACTAVYERITRTCPYCGHTAEPTFRSGPEYVDGDLTELDAQTLAMMRGDVVRVDRSLDDARAEMLANHVPHIGIQAGCKRHTKRQEMQAALRASIAWWAGFQRAHGRNDSESYRRFYFKFGIDVLSAQALNTNEAEALAERINTELGKSVTLPELDKDSEAVQIIKLMPDIVTLKEVSEVTGLKGRAMSKLLIDAGFKYYKLLHIQGSQKVIYIRKDENHTDSTVREFYYQMKHLFDKLPDITTVHEVTKSIKISSSLAPIILVDNGFIKHGKLKINGVIEIVYIRKNKNYTNIDIRRYYDPLKKIIDKLPDIIDLSELSKTTKLHGTELKTRLLNNGFYNHGRIFINDKPRQIYIRLGKTFTKVEIRQFYSKVKHLFNKLPDVTTAEQIKKITKINNHDMTNVPSDNGFYRHKSTRFKNKPIIIYIRKGTPAEHFNNEQIREALTV